MIRLRNQDVENKTENTQIWGGSALEAYEDWMTNIIIVLYMGLFIEKI
jgi:hypothetical protein